MKKKNIESLNLSETKFLSLYSTKHTSYVSFSLKISEIQSRVADQLVRRALTMPP